MKQNISHLRIKPHFTIIPHTSNNVELRKGVWNPSSFTLTDESEKGKLFSILKDLNGKNSVADISKKHDVPRADVEGILDHLQQLGVIENNSSNLLDYYVDQACPSVMQRLYPSKPISGKRIIILGNNPVNRILKDIISTYFVNSEIIEVDETSVQYKTLIGADDQWLYDALKLENEIKIFSDWKDSFVIYAQKVINPIVCSRLNVITHELKIPWIHGAIDGPFLLVGPLFSVPSGPCYSCFETRVSMNLREHASYVRYKQGLVEGKVTDDEASTLQLPLVHLLASHLALDVINFLAMGTGFTRNKVLSIYLPTMEIAFNEVLRVSTCSVCGAAEHRDNQQLYFDYQSLFVRESL